MKNIYEVLKQKQLEYDRLTMSYRQLGDQVSKLGQEINAMQLTVKLLAEAEEPKTDDQQQELSQPKMLRAILAEQGHEMHLQDILSAVEKKFHKKLSPNVIAAVIFRYAKRGSIFYKSSAKPNTWGLLEFEGTPQAKSSVFMANTKGLN